MARDRSDDERDINMLYGCPGADHCSDVGISLLNIVLSNFGMKAFTDDFLLQLAARHRAEEERSAARADAAYRRSRRTGLIGG
jgi:hypothetical protein